MTTGTIVKVSGPLVIAEGMRDANMFDVVRVSEKNLIGEIIEMHGDRASIQVYEETAGLQHRRQQLKPQCLDLLKYQVQGECDSRSLLLKKQERYH